MSSTCLRDTIASVSGCDSSEKGTARTYADSERRYTASRGGEICAVLFYEGTPGLRRSRVQRSLEIFRFWAAVPVEFIIRGDWHPGYREQ